MNRTSEKAGTGTRKKEAGSRNESVRSFTTHVVQDGESLSIIAREHYGNPSLWTRIYEANLDRLNDPNEVYEGQELLVPMLKK